MRQSHKTPDRNNKTNKRRMPSYINQDNRPPVSPPRKKRCTPLDLCWQKAYTEKYVPTKEELEIERELKVKRDARQTKDNNYKR